MLVITLQDLLDAGYREIKPNVYSKIAKIKSDEPKDKKITKYNHFDVKVGNKKFKARSKYEHVYAIYLELLKSKGAIKDWLYEPKTFYFDKIKRGCVSYLPDFQVIRQDSTWYWVECKGYMSKKCATKLNRMRKYFPAEQIELVREDEINKIKQLVNYKAVKI